MRKIKRVLVPLLRKYPDPKYLWDDGKDVGTKFGCVKVSAVDAVKDGEIVVSNRNEKFHVLSPSFIDQYAKIKRLAQIIPLKDIGLIITNAGLGRDSIVLDAGSGSGGLCLFLGNFVKKVHTFDIRKEHLDLVLRNIDYLGLKNVVAKEGDIYKGVPVKNVDCITLDVPEPWDALDAILSSLKVGGFIVSYSPSIAQVSDFVEAVGENKNLLLLKTVEIIEREWECVGRKIRPRSISIGHSGFMTFVRKLV